MDLKEEIRYEIREIGLSPDKCANNEPARHLITQRFLGNMSTGGFQASLLNLNMLNGDLLRSK